MYPTVDTEAVAAALAQRLPAPRPRVLVSVGAGLEAVARELWRASGTPSTVVEAIDVGLPGAGATPPSRIEAGVHDGVPMLVHLHGVRLRDGIDIGAVTAAVDVAATLGAVALVLVSEVTSLIDRLGSGTLAVVTDHLNLTGCSPLVGVAAATGPLGAPVYDPVLGSAARAAARDLGEPLSDAILAGVVGPELPTAAEQRMIRLLGADIVAEGVVPEALAARARRLRTVALSAVAAASGPRRTGHPGVDGLAAIIGKIVQTLQ